MHLESTITERVEALVGHPVFGGSDNAMDLPRQRNGLVGLN